MVVLVALVVRVVLVALVLLAGFGCLRVLVFLVLLGFSWFLSSFGCPRCLGSFGWFWLPSCLGFLSSFGFLLVP